MQLACWQIACSAHFAYCFSLAAFRMQKMCIHNTQSHRKRIQKNEFNSSAFIKFSSFFINSCTCVCVLRPMLDRSIYSSCADRLEMHLYSSHSAKTRIIVGPLQTIRSSLLFSLAVSMHFSSRLTLIFVHRRSIKILSSVQFFLSVELALSLLLPFLFLSHIRFTCLAFETV